MGWHTYFVDNVRHHRLKVHVLTGLTHGVAAVDTGGRHEGRSAAHDLTDVGQQHRSLAGLGNEIGGTVDGAIRHYLTVDKAGEHDNMRLAARLRQTAQQLQTVQLGQNQVQNHDLGAQLHDHCQRFDTVGGTAHGLQITFGIEKLRQKFAEILISVCYQYACFSFHNFILPMCGVWVVL